LVCLDGGVSWEVKVMDGNNPNPRQCDNSSDVHELKKAALKQFNKYYAKTMY
jgi:hypothetical protein